MPWSAARRLRLVRVAAALGLLAALLLAPGLWLPHAYFGPLPIARWLPVPSPSLSRAIFVLLVSLLVPVLVARRAAPWVFLWCALFAARSVPDRLTWQPYFLLYWFLLLAAAAGERGGPARGADALAAMRFALASVYFWSGVSKVEYTFLHGGIVAVLHPISSWFPRDAFLRLALLVPAVEVALAIGLLSRRFRDASAGIAVLMHLSLLYVLGPFGQDYNRVVWPWNAVMIVLVPALFLGDRGAGPRALLRPRASLSHAAALILFGLCPALSWAGVWDPYLSFRLYSYGYHVGTLYLGDAARAALLEPTRAQAVPSGRADLPWKLVIPYWSEHELGAFAPPSPAVYRGVARKVCTGTPQRDDVLLVIDAPADWRTGAVRQTAIRCEEL